MNADKTARGGKLAAELLRRDFGGPVEEDNVIGRGRRPSGGQRPGYDLDWRGTDGSQSLLGLTGQLHVFLQRDHRARETRQHGRGIARPACDIEYTIPTTDAGRVNELGEHHRLEETAALCEW